MEDRQQRLTDQLMKHWEGLRQGGQMPAMERFDRGALGDLWPKCMIIRVEADAPTFQYIGEDVKAAYGCDLTGHPTDTASKGFPGFLISRYLGATVRKKHPTENHGQFMGSKDYSVIKYRACFLPFGNEEKGVTHVVGGLSFKMF